jgi:hypothetical protein
MGVSCEVRTSPTYKEVKLPPDTSWRSIWVYPVRYEHRPVHTTQGTHYVSAIEPSRLMLCKI